MLKAIYKFLILLYNINIKKFLIKEILMDEFDIIQSLYTTLINVTMKKEISAGEFNNICRAYELQGGDTWEPCTFLLRGVSISDPDNIDVNYMKYYNEYLKWRDNGRFNV